MVFDVGEGNLNAIVDAEGKVRAYFDFGYSRHNTKQPSPPTRPCFCDDPIIILSHWDQDHINMSGYVEQCHTAEWLVPEQPHSDFATKLQAKIKMAGGRITTVPHLDHARHIAFPWGYVERCSGPRDDTNGSGLAAFVCVRHSLSRPPAQVATASVEVVTNSAISPVAIRAQQAYAAVPGQVTALIGAINRRAVQRVALPLATMFAASQTIVGRQPHMPIPECVEAAVRAAERVVVHGEDANQARTWLNNQGVLNTLRTPKPAWARAATRELAGAAVRVNQRRCYAARVRAAAGELTRDGSIDESAWTWLGIRAASPLPPAALVLRNGLPARHADERYILLNGDAEFRYVRSLQRTPQPRVVALTAMHHGAIYEKTMMLDGTSIPFAPGSDAARAVVRFRSDRAAAGSVISVVTAAGLALQRRRKRSRRRELRVAASRTARAAAAAIHSLQAVHAGEVGAAPDKFAAVAAAAAVAAWRHPDAAVVGLAALLASTTRNTARKTDTSPIETVVHLAHGAISVRRNGGPGLDNDQIKNLSAGAIDGDLVGHIDNIANAGVTGGNQLLTPDNAGQEAASALGELWDSYKKGLASTKAKNFKNRIELDNHDEDVLNDLATAATAAIQASANGQGHRHRIATASNAAANSISVPGGSLGNVATAVSNTTRTDYWATPANLVEYAAFTAAKLAAERAVAYMVGTTCEAVRAVIASAHDPRLSHEAYNALGRRRDRDKDGGRIAYSYGVDSDDFSHGYGSITVSAGYCGHAHQLAVYKYEARGWTRRLNASNRARHRGAQGDPDRTHPCGHVRLGWDSIQDWAYPPEPSSFRCNRCGKSYRLHS